MLFEGQGNAEERPEYQIMIKRKGSNLETAEKVYKNYCKLYQQSFYFDILYRRKHGDAEC